MNEWQKKMIDVISTHFDCEDCPLDGKECEDEDWANCEEFLSHLLFQESYPNISEEKCKCKEKEETEETTKDKVNPFDFLDSLMKDIESIHVVPVPMEDGHPVIVHIGEMEVIGFAKDVVEFVKQAGDKFAP